MLLRWGVNLKFGRHLDWMWPVTRGAGLGGPIIATAWRAALQSSAELRVLLAAPTLQKGAGLSKPVAAAVGSCWLLLKRRAGLDGPGSAASLPVALQRGAGLSGPFVFLL